MVVRCLSFTECVQLKKGSVSKKLEVLELGCFVGIKRIWHLCGIGTDFLLFFFFFSSRRRHTRWNCDWSSDVCSSDLAIVDRCEAVIVRDGGGSQTLAGQGVRAAIGAPLRTRDRVVGLIYLDARGREIGRASCRERV